MHQIIYEASVTGIIRLLLVIFIVYIIYNLFMRIIFPSVMRKYVSDIQKQFNPENQRTQQEQNRKKEGEVSIKFVNKDKSTTNNPDDGEYVDYEEVK
jgi:hypothetical protein